MIYLILSNVIVILTISAHMNPSFPGQNVNKPPENIHQQSQPHQQAQAIPNQPAESQHFQQQQPPSNQATMGKPHEFGGQEAKNAEHIKEHLQGQIDPSTTMTEEQLQFHYFKMHDLNKDGCLDGTELIKALSHLHTEPNNEMQPPLPMTEMQLEETIDQILRLDDFDKNGCISFAEFSKGQNDRNAQVNRT